MTELEYGQVHERRKQGWTSSSIVPLWSDLEILARYGVSHLKDSQSDEWLKDLLYFLNLFWLAERLIPDQTYWLTTPVSVAPTKDLVPARTETTHFKTYIDYAPPNIVDPKQNLRSGAAAAAKGDREEKEKEVKSIESSDEQLTESLTPFSLVLRHLWSQLKETRLLILDCESLETLMGNSERAKTSLETTHVAFMTKSVKDYQEMRGIRSTVRDSLYKKRVDVATVNRSTKELRDVVTRCNGLLEGLREIRQYRQGVAMTNDKGLQWREHLRPDAVVDIPRVQPFVRIPKRQVTEMQQFDDEQKAYTPEPSHFDPASQLERVASPLLGMISGYLNFTELNNVRQVTRHLFSSIEDYQNTTAYLRSLFRWNDNMTDPVMSISKLVTAFVQDRTIPSSDEHRLVMTLVKRGDLPRWAWSIPTDPSLRDKRVGRRAETLYLALPQIRRQIPGIPWHDKRGADYQLIRGQNMVDAAQRDLTAFVDRFKSSPPTTLTDMERLVHAKKTMGGAPVPPTDELKQCVGRDAFLGVDDYILLNMRNTDFYPVVFEYLSQPSWLEFMARPQPVPLRKGHNALSTIMDLCVMSAGGMSVGRDIKIVKIIECLCGYERTDRTPRFHLNEALNALMSLADQNEKIYSSKNLHGFLRWSENEIDAFFSFELDRRAISRYMINFLWVISELPLDGFRGMDSPTFETLVQLRPPKMLQRLLDLSVVDTLRRHGVHNLSRLTSYSSTASGYNGYVIPPYATVLSRAYVEERYYHKNPFMGMSKQKMFAWQYHHTIKTQDLIDDVWQGVLADKNTVRTWFESDHPHPLARENPVFQRWNQYSHEELFYHRLMKYLYMHLGSSPMETLAWIMTRNQHVRLSLAMNLQMDLCRQFVFFRMLTSSEPFGFGDWMTYPRWDSVLAFACDLYWNDNDGRRTATSWPSIQSMAALEATQLVPSLSEYQKSHRFDELQPWWVESVEDMRAVWSMATVIHAMRPDLAHGTICAWIMTLCFWSSAPHVHQVIQDTLIKNPKLLTLLLTHFPVPMTLDNFLGRVDRVRLIVPKLWVDRELDQPLIQILLQNWEEHRLTITEILGLDIYSWIIRGCEIALAPTQSKDSTWATQKVLDYLTRCGVSERSTLLWRQPRSLQAWVSVYRALMTKSLTPVGVLVFLIWGKVDPKWRPTVQNLVFVMNQYQTHIGTRLLNRADPRQIQFEGYIIRIGQTKKFVKINLDDMYESTAQTLERWRSRGETESKEDEFDQDELVKRLSNSVEKDGAPSDEEEEAAEDGEASDEASGE